MDSELDRYKAALAIARKKGEHYPTCNMPPPEVRKADIETQHAWREAHRGQCDCWKAEMEAVLANGRCRSVWRAGVLVAPGVPEVPDGARCTLPTHGGDVEHKYERKR